MRRLAFMLALVLIAVPAMAGDRPVFRGTMVSLSEKEPAAKGYLVLPQKALPAKPALILVQEWWGLNDWIKENADRYAAKGYVVVVPDLYRGSVASDSDTAHQLMRGMPEDRALADLQAAFVLLAARKDVDPKRIGVTGWCMGGGYALSLGIAEPRLAAVAINYGRLVTDSATIAKIKSPVMGNFGGQDKGIPADAVMTFKGELDKLGIANDFKVFEAAGHGFMNPNNAKGYDAKAAEESWKRLDAFFEKLLVK